MLNKTIIAVHADCLKNDAELTAWVGENGFVIVDDLRHPDCAELSVLLRDDQHRLSLFKVENKQKMRVCVDFVGGTQAYRRQQASVKNEMLARALGLKANSEKPLWVIDATAGFGRDSMLLASLGCVVTLVERSRLMCFLLKDGMQRAAHLPELLPILSRMQLLPMDACDYLTALNQSKTAHDSRPDAIYLDPMFPASKNTAQVKKDMRILREVLDEEDDGDLLLRAALSSGASRVVVKRPRKAEHLGARKPNHSVDGQSSRFDVYLSPQ